jgi:hypothetical protein
VQADSQHVNNNLVVARRGWHVERLIVRWFDKSSITGLVDRAERRGLVARAPSEADRRAVRVILTDEGRSLVSQISTRFEADVSVLLGCLPAPDRGALAGLISRLLVAHAASQGVDLFATIGAVPRS